MHRDLAWQFDDQPRSNKGKVQWWRGGADFGMTLTISTPFSFFSFLLFLFVIISRNSALLEFKHTI